MTRSKKHNNTDVPPAAPDASPLGDDFEDNPSETNRSRSWVFVINNYTPEEEHIVKTMECRYVIFGYELGSKKQTPHLQGYVVWHDAKTYRPTKKALGGRCWTQIAMGNSLENFNYATKDKRYFEKGLRPLVQEEKVSASKRKWDEAMKACLAGDIKGYLRQNPTMMSQVRCLERCQQLFAAPHVVPVPNITLRPWQEEVIKLIVLPADDRKVNFYVDLRGNAGKSTFAQYICAVYPDIAQVCDPAEFREMAYLVDTTKHVVIIDVPRYDTAMPYAFMECCKNKRITSSKYENTVKHFSKPVHVLVFCNAMPNLTALSADRFVITELK